MGFEASVSAAEWRRSLWFCRFEERERTSEAIAVSAENTITATVMILVVSTMLEKA